MPDEEPGEMVVRIRLFAVLRERLGTDSLELRLPRHATVGDALVSLRERPALGAIPGDIPVVMAVNREYADDATVLSPGDELALIPPVSGGEAEPTRLRVRVTDQPLDPARASAAVADPGAGAIVIFQGVTREVAGLHYEAYAEMAVEQIEAIACAAMSTHALSGVRRAPHRRCRVGRAVVLVAVSSPTAMKPSLGHGASSTGQGASADLEARTQGRAPGKWLAGLEVRP